MERIQPVRNWFTDRGGKYFGDSAPSYYRDENYEGFVEIENSGNHEVQYCGLQIFINEEFYDNDAAVLVLQYLLEHGRNDDKDDTSLEDAINELEPLVPEDAELEISHSIGTDVFLLRELNTEELRPEKLDAILTPLTKFAEFATTKVSILHTAPEFILKNQTATGSPDIW
jgi:hypothetical protein